MWGVLVIALAAGAPARARTAEKAPAAESGPVASLRRAHEAFADGGYERAAKILAGLEGRLPRNADYVTYLAAESEFYAGRPGRARLLFERLARDKASRFAPIAPWRAADCFWEAGARPAAAAAYRRLLAPPAPPRRRPSRKGRGAPPPPPPPRAARPPAGIDVAVARFRLATLATGPEAAALFRGVYVDFPAHPLAEEARRRAGGAPAGDAGDAPRAASPPEASVDDRLRRARGLAETKRYAEAVRELEALPGALPAEVRVERDWELGMAKFRMRRDYARAAELLLGIVDKLDPDRAATAAFHGARALSRSNRDDEAIAGYRRVVDRFPQSRWAAEAQFLSGWLDFNRARYAAALPGLEATIARHPRSPFAEDAAWFVALCRFFAGDHAGALDAFARYEKRGASGPEAAEAARRGTYYRGRSLAALGRKDEAHALYREAARRWPFHFYGLLARSRLREAGAPAELDLPPGRAALGPIGPAAARDPAVARADELAAAGLDVEAGVELQRAEEAIRKRLGRDQGLAVLLNRYPRFSNWHRPYYLAETSGDAALAGAPAGAARAFWEAAYPRAYRGLVERFAPPAGTPPLVLYAIMRKESGFSPHVVSYADARGLLQMIPPTSARVAGELGLPFAPDDLFVPETNVQLGAAYIGGLFRKFRGEILLTAAAYNGGPRAVMRWCDGNGRRPTDEFVELVTYDQTREYAKRVAGIYAHYHYLYEGKPFDLPLTVDCRYEAGGPEY